MDDEQIDYMKSKQEYLHCCMYSSVDNLFAMKPGNACVRVYMYITETMETSLRGVHGEGLKVGSLIQRDVATQQKV